MKSESVSIVEVKMDNLTLQENVHIDELNNNSMIKDTWIAVQFIGLH